MKRWALVIVAMYIVILLLLAAPVVMLAFGPDKVSVDGILSIYAEPVLWIWVGVMALSQAALLFVPVGTAERRPKARQRLMVPVIASACLMTALAVGVIGCVLLAIYGDGGTKPGIGTITVSSTTASAPAATLAAPPAVSSGPSENEFWSAAIAITLGLWLFWGAVFYKFRRSTDPDALTGRLMRWLLGGSVLELLVAVPSHIIVRERGDCCAPIGTFFGISMGISVMLMSFGPGVFLLYAKRIERLRGGPGVYCKECGYDMRATPQRCPECGAVADGPDKVKG
jgi:hypothetical protein